MATEVESLKIRVGMDASAVTKGSRSALLQVEALKVGVKAAAQAFKFLGGQIAEAVKASNVQEKALVELSAALGRAGVQDVKRATNEFANFAAKMQEVTTVGDEVSIQAASIGASFGITGKALQDTVKAAADLSAVTGQDLKSAMILLGKAAKGETGSLSRYGIIIDKNTPASQKFSAALSEINSQFGGAAQAKAESFSGKMEQVGNLFGDIQELVGDQFKPALKEALDFFGEFAKGVLDNRDAVGKGIRRIIGMVLESIKFTGTAIGFLFSKLTSAGAAVREFQAFVYGELSVFFARLSDLPGLGSVFESARQTTAQWAADYRKEGENLRLVNEKIADGMGEVVLVLDKMKAKTEEGFTPPTLSLTPGGNGSSEGGDNKSALELRKEQEKAFTEAYLEEIRKRQEAEAASLDASIQKWTSFSDALSSSFLNLNFTWKNMLQTMGQWFTSFITQMIADWFKGLVTAKLVARKKVVMESGVASAAAARSAFQTLPIPASFGAAPAAAAGAKAAVMAAGSFHEGGMVGQSDLMRLPGMAPDEGLILAQSGEMVLPRGEAAGGINITVNNNTAGLSDKASNARWVRDVLLPALRESTGWDMGLVD